MDILLVNKFFFEKGGAERYLFSLAQALEERGHRVLHFSMHHPQNHRSPYERHFVREKSYEDSLSLGEMFSSGASFIRSKEAARKMRELLEEHRPQIAHFHNIYHQITPSIIPVLQRAGIPILMTLHDYKLLCPNYCFFARGAYCNRCFGGRFYRAATTRCSRGSFARGALLALEAYWQKWTRVYDGVRAFLAPSRFIREQFIKAGFDPSRVIHLPSFVEKGNRSGGLGADSESLAGLPGRYILYFGRLSEEKGLETLLTAIRDCGDVPLVLAGDGPQHEHLRQFAESNRLPVHFTGYVRKPLLDRIIQGARAVVQPSIWPENAPFTVLEAAAQSVPVIVSDMGGLPEMAGLLGGLVFPNGDSAALAGRIRAVWSDDELANRIGREAAAGVQTHFREKTHVDALEAIYQSVLEGCSLSPPDGVQVPASE